MNGAQHQGCVRCTSFHSTNPRIVLTGGDDRTIRLWRLYPHNPLYQSPHADSHANNKQSNTANATKHEHPNANQLKPDSESDEEVELGLGQRANSASQERESDDDDPNKFITDFDPSIQPLSHLLSMPASGEVKGLCMSPYNGEILVATSSRLFNQKSSLDIISIPHWTWNYSSSQRLPYKLQLREKLKSQQTQSRPQSVNGSENSHELNLVINSLDDELDAEQQANAQKNNPFIENQATESMSADFVDRPNVIPLPYGARERCLTFSPSPNIVFVGLLSCRKKHQRRYCCLMACNILNGASRPCKKMNALLHRKECIYSVKLTCNNANDTSSTLNKEDDEKKEYEEKPSNGKVYRLALGTNLGRLIIVTLKRDLSWNNTRRSFITEYTVAFEKDPISNESVNEHNNTSANGTVSGLNQQSNGNAPSSSGLFGASDQNNAVGNNSTLSSFSAKAKSPKKSKHHRKVSSKYSVLTSRERCFREMADPTTVMITYESMKKYLWNQSSQIEEQDIKEFFRFLRPNKKNQITFTQFVQRVDEDGNFMRAFEQFCMTGSSRTDRRPWMDDVDDSDYEEEKGGSGQKQGGKKNHQNAQEDEDSDWELAMLNNRGGDHLTDKQAVTSIAWNSSDSWIITGHQDGDIKFWSKEYYPSSHTIEQNKYLKRSPFYYVCRGAMKRHSEAVSCLSLSGTYLVSSSQDGNILIWHLDFLLPSINLPMNITFASRGIIQLLATINSAHLGDEIWDVQLSKLSNNIQYCMPNALYLLSCGADESIRCRDVMEILRQQLTLRILAESQPQTESQEQRGLGQDGREERHETFPQYESYTSKRMLSVVQQDDSDEGSDFGATSYD